MPSQVSTFTETHADGESSKLEKNSFQLSEDQVDDLLYYARTGSLSDLTELLGYLAKLHNTSPDSIVFAAVDIDNGNTPLHMACANGHIEIVKYLLYLNSGSTSSSSMIDLSNSSGNTSLHWAALNGHFEAVKLLVEAGADISNLNLARHDAVAEAEKSGKVEVAEWLLNHRRDQEEIKGPEEPEETLADGVAEDKPEQKKVEEAELTMDCVKEGLSDLAVQEEI